MPFFWREVEALGSRAMGLGLRLSVLGLGFRLAGLGFRVSGVLFRELGISGLGVGFFFSGKKTFEVWRPRGSRGVQP